MPEFKLRYVIDADGRKAKAELQDVDRLMNNFGANAGVGFAAIGASAAVAAAGVAAVGTAAIAVGRTLYDLSKQAADFGSLIFDASQKTGLTAESLSAMKFAADQSGASLDDITNGIARFAKEVGAAADGSEKAAAKLKDFGIEPQAALNDLDAALATVFKRIQDAKPGIEQITLAQKAFGRSGADLLPFIKSFDGDLAGLTARAKELGVTIDDEAARASDEFGDQLDTLSAQFEGVGRTIGQAFMPIFMDMATATSEWFVRNKGEIKEWSEAAATGFQASGSMISQWASNVANATAELMRFKAVQQIVDFRNWWMSSVDPFGKMAFDAYNQAAQDRSIQNAFDNAVRATENYTKQWQRLQQIRSGNRGTYDADTGGGSRRSSANDADRAAREAQRLAEQRERERIADARAFMQNETEYFAAESAKRLAIAEYGVEQGVQTERDFALFRIEQEESVTNYKIEKLREYFKQLVGGTDEYKQAEQQLRIAEIDRDTLRQGHAKRRLELDKKYYEESGKMLLLQIEREHEIYLKQKEQREELERQNEERREAHRIMMIEGLEKQIGGPKVNQTFEGGFLSSLGIDPTQTVNDIDIIGGAFERLGSMTTNVIGQMAQGVGSMVEQWVLYGTAGPDAVRKMTAAVLGNLAAQATVEAIMELARGFAALANPFTAWQAPLHFKAAALFGAVAAGAAVAGRLVAGDSFQNQSGGSAGGGSTSSSSTSSPSAVSRVSSDAYISGRRSDPATVALARAVEKLEMKIDGMRPGEVLSRGASERPGLIGKTAVNDMASNAGIGLQFRRKVIGG